VLHDASRQKLNKQNATIQKQLDRLKPLNSPHVLRNLPAMTQKGM